MINLAVNLSLLFTEVPFLERFQQAARAGFTRVETQFPYHWPIQAQAEHDRASKRAEQTSGATRKKLQHLLKKVKQPKDVQDAFHLAAPGWTQRLLL